jgi:hypothetical protein
MPAMIVLINLKDDVRPEDYERWILESYAPAVKSLSSVEDWRDYRASGLLGSDAAPPYRYVVTLEVVDPEQLGRDSSPSMCAKKTRSRTFNPKFSLF